MKKLSKWQWIGLALSAIWVVAVIYSDYGAASKLADDVSTYGYRSCIDDQTRTHTLNIELCETEKSQEYNKMMSGQVTNALVGAFLPLPFLWLYGYLLLILARSFKYGYSNVVNTQNLSRPKKLFAYFCYFYLVIC